MLKSSVGTLGSIPHTASLPVSFSQIMPIKKGAVHYSVKLSNFNILNTAKNSKAFIVNDFSFIAIRLDEQNISQSYF